MNHELQLHHEEFTYDKNVFGFWVYLMTDCVLFGILFASYAVLHNSVFGGPSGKDIFDLKLVLAETFALLISSFTCGLAGISSEKGYKGRTIFCLILTFLLGATFVHLEVSEFIGLVKEGYGWDRSAFLSSFFTLVGTHGTHVSIGLIWMTVMIVQIAFRGLTHATLRRLMCLRLFWHFLDVVWIFIFTIVYLMGVL